MTILKFISNAFAYVIAIACSFLGIISFSIYMFSIYVDNNNKNIILSILPPYIEFDYIIQRAGTDVMFESCGVIALKLSLSTLNDIKSDRNFLQDHAEALVKTKDQGQFSHWQSTPFPESTFSDGAPYSIGCAVGLNVGLRNGLIEQMKSTGAFYAGDSGNIVVVDINTARLYILYRL